VNALVKADNPKVAEQKQYLTFTLGGEMFSIGILRIKEIIWYAQLTELPMMPACIRGVINLRGAVVPVMDLSTRFGNQRHGTRRGVQRHSRRGALNPSP
jgi:chemotaxis signal transduction protein